MPNSTTTSNDYIDIYLSIYRPGNILDSISYRYDLVQNQADLYLQVGGHSELSYFIGTAPIQTYPGAVYATICNDTVYNISELFQHTAVQGHTYGSVYHIGIKHKLDACYSSARDDHFYINRDAGMIKMTLNNYTHKVWELERWNITR